ncbi:alpha/beta fold hydrolase [Streptomyces griseus]|uniref:alpha/beta fold hydrolase n=1 Tax=Streptomyces griseus TaxID=1911 RepID=UPI0037BB4EEE
MIVVLHGGHMRAGLSLGEKLYGAAGYSLLVPSRPGYGATDLSVGAAPEGFADAVAVLCGLLGIDQVEACAGVSAGGPTAVALAARHPDLVRRLVLESAVGPLSWPGAGTRRLGRVVFSPRSEGAVWRLTRWLLERRPEAALSMLLAELTTGRPQDVLDQLSGEHRAEVIALLSSMRSGRGFVNDLAQLGGGRRFWEGRVAQPALVIASRRDGSVPYAHAVELARTLPRAELVDSEAAGHFVWFGPDRNHIEQLITEFLAQDATAGGG